MRVAYLINQYPMVSHSFIRREIHALERRGIEVVRIAHRGWNSDLADPEDQVERKRTRYILLGGTLPLAQAIAIVAMTRPLALLRCIVMAWRLSRHSEQSLPKHLIYLAEACRVIPWLSSARIDHLHAHFGTNSAEVAMYVHNLGGPRWSFTVHGPKEFDRPRFLGLPEKIRDCTSVVAISSFGRSQLYRLVEHHHWHKIRVVHCGLESNFYAGAAILPPPDRRLVCVGRLCEQKGQLLLIEAAKRLFQRGEPFDLVLAGDGEMRAEIERSIARQGLQSSIRITGWLSAAQVRDEILSSRALVLPSFAEGLPVVLMEAMALRRPVISTFVAGIPELVIPGEHGWVVPAGDVDALADAMRACLDAPADRLARMGEAAHQRILERHNVDTEAAKLAELFAAAGARSR